MELCINKKHIKYLMEGVDEAGEEYKWANVVKDGLVE